MYDNKQSLNGSSSLMGWLPILSTEHRIKLRL